MSEQLQAGGGGLVHLGGYEIDGRAGWTPVCGASEARRWFRVGLDADCPRCLALPAPWTVAMVLDAVEDIADDLERGLGGTLTDIGTVDRVLHRLRALRGDSTGESEPVARMRAAVRLYGPQVPAVNTDECEGCGLPESNCACG